MEDILIGLPEFSIQKVLSKQPLLFEVAWTAKVECPHCASHDVSTKDSFWRYIKNVPLRETPSSFKVKCHKYQCKECGKYFNTRLPGVKKWSRTTELLKRRVFYIYNKGYTNKDIAQ